MADNKPLRIEVYKGFQPRRVGVRVIADCAGWPGPPAKLRILGSIDPDGARAAGQALIAAADAVDARNAKEDAAEQRRRAWHERRPNYIGAVSWKG